MVWLTRLESTLRRYGRKRSRSSTACDGAVPAVDGSSGMLRCALQMVSSETITAGHPMQAAPPHRCRVATSRSEEHTSELQSLMRISYAVFCLKKKKNICTHIVTS